MGKTGFGAGFNDAHITAYMRDLFAVRADEFEPLIEQGISLGWEDWIVASVERRPELAYVAIPRLSETARDGLYHWASRRAGVVKASEIAAAAIYAGDLDDAAIIMRRHYDPNALFYPGPAYDATAERMLAGDPEPQFAMIRSHQTPFPLLLESGRHAVLVALQHRVHAWILQLLDATSLSRMGRVRRTDLIRQAVIADHYAMEHDGTTGSLIWLTRHAVDAGTIRRDARFKAALLLSASSSSSLDALAALGAAADD